MIDMDTQENTVKIQDDRNKSLSSIDKSLQSLALLKMADEFYSKEERKELYEKFHRLVDEDHTMYERLHDQSIEDHAKKLQERQRTSKALDEFRKQHRIICRIIDCEAALGKFRWE